MQRGVVSISISLNNFDLKQCGAKPVSLVTGDEIEVQETIIEKNVTMEDPFFGTDKCEKITTEVILKKQQKIKTAKHLHCSFKCVNIPNKGFVRGSYVCKCREGYYYPTSKSFSGFDGVIMEQHYSNGSSSLIDSSYKCIKCSKGCKTCNGMSAIY